MSSRRQNKFKVVMLGEGRVGKTSLLQRYLHNNFDEQSPSTVKATMYSSKKIDAGGTVVDVAIWDTAGQEKFRALGPIYYRDAHGAVLVYDITDQESFARVRIWIRELHQAVGEKIVVCIIGNKVDLERERKVSKQEADEFCREIGASHFLCSAKLGIRVPDAFQALAEKIVETQGGGGGAGGGPASPRGYGTGGAGAGPMAGGRGKHGGVKVTLDEPVPVRTAEEKKCPC